VKKWLTHRSLPRNQLNLIWQNSSGRKLKVSKKEMIIYIFPELIRRCPPATGPITVAEYMREVLTNPTSGYYMFKDVFGQQGDFITSPEINQIFGEVRIFTITFQSSLNLVLFQLIAIWCLTEWQKIGSPSPLQIVELGPGRGTLIQDMLRVFNQFKQEKQVTFHLVEISPYLSKLQSQKLCYNSKEIDERHGCPHYREGETVSGARIFWYKRIEDIPNGFTCLLAHEFFDALPINKFQRGTDGVWKEILIDIEPSNANQFRYVISRTETPTSKLFNIKFMAADEKRNHVEYSFEAETTLNHIANRLEEHGGIGLIMDYGHFGDKGDTFRAFKNHKLHDALHDPGTADLTADVDFKHIKASCEKSNKLIAYGPIEQHQFLERMGGKVRLEALLQNSTEDMKKQLVSGYDMLTRPEQMGSRFKFLSLFPAVLGEHLKKHPVAGFDGVS
jgi:NADH dehydrogenase [ubiquinone] 1 alpha subcomplex assembly factor 7